VERPAGTGVCLVSASTSGPESIALPERLDRPARLGPFPSAASALRFLLVSALGALVALRWGPLLWPPFLAVGFLLEVHRPDGLSLDERVTAYLRWRWRSFRPPSAAGHRPAPNGSVALLRTPSGRWAGGFETGGVPVAFRPPEDAARMFETYRQLLRSTSGPSVIRLDRAPLRVERFRPSAPPGEAAERAAREGYGELVRLLARRRHLRRVRWVLWSEPGASTAVLPKLERELAAVSTALGALEVPHRRLRGAELARALGAEVSSRTER